MRNPCLHTVDESLLHSSGDKRHMNRTNEHDGTHIITEYFVYVTLFTTACWLFIKPFFFPKLVPFQTQEDVRDAFIGNILGCVWVAPVSDERGVHCTCTLNF